jgi:hypothetical protein
MKRRWSPQDKKEHEYRRQRRPWLGVPSTARTNWPWFEKAASRKYRHRVRQVLAQERIANEPEIKSQVPVKRVPIRRLSRPMSLRELIAVRRDNQVWRAVWHFVHEPYESEKHRLRFAAFLASLPDQSTPYAQAAARLFGLLTEPPANNWRWESRTVTREGPRWLRAFFADEPEWEPRLRAWIASFED